MFRKGWHQPHSCLPSICEFMRLLWHLCVYVTCVTFMCSCDFCDFMWLSVTFMNYKTFVTLWLYVTSMTFVTLRDFCDFRDFLWLLWLLWLFVTLVTFVTFVTLCDPCHIRWRWGWRRASQWMTTCTVPDALMDGRGGEHEEPRMPECKTRHSQLGWDADLWMYGKIFTRENFFFFVGMPASQISRPAPYIFR